MESSPLALAFAFGLAPGGRTWVFMEDLAASVRLGYHATATSRAVANL
jgi:hypothetical protein